MIPDDWPRIAGLQSEENGDIGLVWLARDKDTDTIHIYDACIFRREVLAVIAEGINCRGRWIPVAWESGAKEIADKLLDKGCSMLYDPVKDTAAVSEAASREIWERMRTSRFKVDKRLSEWQDEYKTFYRQGQKVPKGKHPLMTATRYAVSNIQYAKRQSLRKAKSMNYPKLAIV